MRRKSETRKEPAEKVIKDIRRATRKRYSAEEKKRRPRRVIPPLIEMGGDGLDAEGTALGSDGKIEDEAYHMRFLLLDGQDFLVLRAAPLLRHDGVSKGAREPFQKP